MEWQIGSVPPAAAAVFDVWLENGQVRTVRGAETVFGGVLMFMDCNHPAQNAFCEPSKIIGWRQKESPTTSR